MAARHSSPPPLSEVVPVTDCPACHDENVIETGAFFAALNGDANVTCMHCRHTARLSAFTAKARRRLGWVRSLVDASRRERVVSVAKSLEMRGSDDEALKDWFAACKASGMPDIVRRRGTRYTTVRWDFSALSPEAMKVFRARKDELARGFERIASRNGLKPPFYEEGEPGEGYVVFKKLEHQQAATLADEIYDYLVETLQLKRNPRHH
jgi:hypothetical protein